MPGNANRPIILSGFSQGAIMALSYTLLHPDDGAGVIAFSGYIPEMVLDAVPGRVSEAVAPRVFLTQGRRDQLFPFSRLQETTTQLMARGIRPTSFAHDGAHEIPLAAVEAARSWVAQEFPTGKRA